MYYIGVDYHKKYSYVVVKDREGRVERRGKVDNTKVRAIAEARIKTDKISADILCDLLRSNPLPEAYVPNKETREAKNILRQRMFFVRVQTMVKNRIYTILSRDSFPGSRCLGFIWSFRDGMAETGSLTWSG